MVGLCLQFTQLTVSGKLLLVTEASGSHMYTLLCVETGVQLCPFCLMCVSANPQKPEAGVGPLGAEVTGCYEPEVECSST